MHGAKSEDLERAATKSQTSVVPAPPPPAGRDSRAPDPLATRSLAAPSSGLPSSASSAGSLSAPPPMAASVSGSVSAPAPASVPPKSSSFPVPAPAPRVTSVPPPPPPEALRTGSYAPLPSGSAPPGWPASGNTGAFRVPPPPPPRHPGASSVPPAMRSGGTGAFAIPGGPPRSVPPPPPPRREDALALLAKANEELRLLRFELERTREQLRGRDLHIGELKQELEDKSAEVRGLENKLQDALERAQAGGHANDAGGDDLKRIRGIGPLYERKLKAMGISRYGDLAVWQDADLVRVAEALGTHRTRIERAGWIEQAKALASE